MPLNDATTGDAPDVQQALVAMLLAMCFFRVAWREVITAADYAQQPRFGNGDGALLQPLWPRASQGTNHLLRTNALPFPESAKAGRRRGSSRKAGIRSA